MQGHRKDVLKVDTQDVVSILQLPVRYVQDNTQAVKLLFMP